MMKYIAIIIAATLLVSCAKPNTVVEYRTHDCPPVNQCIKPKANFKTVGDLTKGYTALESAFEQCKIARDILNECVRNGKTDINTSSTTVTTIKDTKTTQSTTITESK